MISRHLPLSAQPEAHKIDRMETLKLVAIDCKRKRALNVDDLKAVFDTELLDYQRAWNDLKARIVDFIEHPQPTVTSVNSSQRLYY